MCFSGQVLEFGDACVFVVVWVVDRSDRLELLDSRQVFVFKGEAAVGKLSMAISEILVDLPAIYDVSGVRFVPDRFKVGIEVD